MLNLALYQQTRLQPRPLAHRAIADGFLRHEYRRKVALRVVGLERIPEGPVIYAMNHTDAFNYWPFQYALHRAAERYTAAWVKGKNYDGFVASRFMRWTNNIPLASRGYVITRDFVSTVGRLPSADEYRVLRTLWTVRGPSRAACRRCCSRAGATCWGAGSTRRARPTRRPSRGS
jgi:hypothetical protein